MEEEEKEASLYLPLFPPLPPRLSCCFPSPLPFFSRGFLLSSHDSAAATHDFAAAIPDSAAAALIQLSLGPNRPPAA
jgi:hypothetical protein